MNEVEKKKSSAEYDQYDNTIWNLRGTGQQQDVIRDKDRTEQESIRRE